MLSKKAAIGGIVNGKGECQVGCVTVYVSQWWEVYSVHTAGRNGYTYRLNMELDLQRLFGLHVTW
jgi:hypothetical protein